MSLKMMNFAGFSLSPYFCHSGPALWKGVFVLQDLDNVTEKLRLVNKNSRQNYYGVSYKLIAIEN